MNFFLIFLLFQVFDCSIALEINGQFKYCLLNSNLAMVNNLCEEENENDFKVQTVIKQSAPLKLSAFVFSKHKFILETTGYQCSMILFNVKFGRDIFFSKYTESKSHFVKLTKSDCQTMVQDKKCGNAELSYPMLCYPNGSCNYKPNITGEYPLFGSFEKIFYECSFNKRVIMAQNLNTTIFSNSLGNCFAEDEVCFLATSTIIWERQDIRKCLFERLIELNEMVKYVNKNKILVYSEKAKLLFNLKEEIIDCGFTFHRTSEGLYLSFFMKNSLLKKNLLALKTSSNKLTHFLDADRQDILLSENDFTQFKTIQTLKSIQCRNLKNLINSNIEKRDTFLQVTNMRNENVQLYIDRGKVFLPTCTNVNKVSVQEKMNNLPCTRFPQVYFESPYSSNKIKGYIRFNNIITEQDTQIECSLRKTTMIIEGENKKYFNIKMNGEFQTVNEFTTHIEDLKINRVNLNNYFEHHSLLFNGSDFYEQFNEFLNPLVHSDKNEELGSINEIKENLSGIRSSNWSFKSIRQFFSTVIKSFEFSFICTLFFIFLLFITIFLIYKFK